MKAKLSLKCQYAGIGGNSHNCMGDNNRDMLKG